MRVVAFAWVVLLAVGGLAQSVATADVTRPDGGVAVADAEPWQSWKTEQGYPTNRRLIQPVALSQAHIRIADLLSAAQQQTGVKLSAQESELQDQELTVFARDLPLNALMVQMAQLLGLYWYQRIVDGQIGYVVSYGSNAPVPSATEERRVQDARFRDLRASRIADYIHALPLTEEQLCELGKADPSLAGTMLQYPATRYGAEALAAMRPQSLRRLIESGDALVGCDELPTWFEKGLRDSFDPNDWKEQGTVSADLLVSRFRLRFISPNVIVGPEHGATYDTWGRMWMGLQYFPVIVPGDRADASPEAATRLPFLPFAPGKPLSPMGGILPGRMEDQERARALFPEVQGVKADRSLSERVGELLTEGEERRHSDAARSPYRDDPKLSQKPGFPLEPRLGLSALLEQVAEQTGYAVLATSFEAQDAVASALLSGDEPIYMLLNRAGQAAKCSWSLAGTVIRWRHDDWYLLETRRASKPSPSPH